MAWRGGFEPPSPWDNRLAVYRLTRLGHLHMRHLQRMSREPSKDMSLLKVWIGRHAAIIGPMTSIAKGVSIK